MAEVVGGLRHARKRQDDVAGHDLLLDPGVVREDVALPERETLPPGEALQVRPFQVERDDLVVRGLQNFLGQVAPDETVRPQQQYPHRHGTSLKIRPTEGRRPFFDGIS